MHNEIAFDKKFAEQGKRHNPSQEELIKMVRIHANVLRRYEKDIANPSIEADTKLAETKSFRRKKESILFFPIDALLKGAKTHSAYVITH